MLVVSRARVRCALSRVRALFAQIAMSSVWALGASVACLAAACSPEQETFADVCARMCARTYDCSMEKPAATKSVCDDVCERTELLPCAAEWKAAAACVSAEDACPRNLSFVGDDYSESPCAEAVADYHVCESEGD